MAREGVEVIPSAKRMVRSLRDMGYEFAAAVADLIDNSIEARANTVDVSILWKGADSLVMISDNGAGMTLEVLKEALRFGSNRDYDDSDLGKFGLGLKTASLSQCLKVTVATRSNPNRADISAYCWDVEHIEETNRWEILSVRPADLPEGARSHLKQAPGTVVIWEQLDRVLGYKHPDGEYARKHLFAMAREVEDHVSMVFHRFLAKEVRGKKLNITVNGNRADPWDPFARNEAATLKMDASPIKLEGVRGRGEVIVEPYVLPTQAMFSSPAMFARASGPRKWNAQQGFYIYRADRMIQSGGWCGIRATDEHRKLARIALSFTPKLDEEFKVNVPKMRVQLPADIRDEIDNCIKLAVKEAEKRYRGAPPKSNASARGDSSRSVSPSPSATAQVTVTDRAAASPAGASSRANSSLDAFEDFSTLLLEAAFADEIEPVERALKRARARIGK